MPLDRGIIDQQLQALGEGTGWWDRRELRDLPAVLRTDERILAIAYGKVGRIRWLRRSWLIVVTDARLLCLKSYGRSWRQIEVDVDRIARLAIRVGPFRGRLHVVAGGERLRLLTRKAKAYSLLNALNSVVVPANEQQRGFGAVRVVRRVMDHVLALPAVAFGPDAPQATPPPAPKLLPADDYVQKLESEVEQLRQQVDFLEQLLQQRRST